MHKVPKEGVQRLLNWLPTTTTTTTVSSPPPTTITETSIFDEDDGHDDQKNVSSNSQSALCCSYSCIVCNSNFDNVDALFEHQNNVGHVKTSSAGRSSSPTVCYLCWSNGCKENFDSLTSVQNHFRQVHASPTSTIGGVIKKCDADSTTNLKCPICFRLCRSNVSLQSHIERSHVNNSTTTATTAEKGFKNLIQKQNKTVSSPTPFNNGGGVVDEQRLSSELNNDGSSSDLDWSTTFTDEHLNSPTLAESCYGDPNRTFKCDRCEMAFTKQIFLTVHNRTLQHRQNIKLSSPSSRTSAATNGVVDIDKKYKDPCRPYKCDICKESFTQKNILIVHCNSVSHLNKLKKLSSSTSSSPTASVKGNSSPSTALSSVKRNLSPSAVDGSKNYKCNICKLAYGSSSTLDVHLRSVAHQSRVGRLYELIAVGDIDLNVPLIEQPDVDNRSLTIDKKKKSSINDDKQLLQNIFQRTSASPTNILNQFSSPCDDVWQNLLAAATSTSIKNNEDLLLNGKLSTANNCRSSPNQQPLTNLEQIVQSGFHKNNGSGKAGLAFRKMLENYGFEVVMQYNEAHHRKRSKLSSIVDELASSSIAKENDQPDVKKCKKSNETNTKETLIKQIGVGQQNLPELTKCKCVYCEMNFSSVWVLKAHVEQVHKRLIPVDEVEKISNEFKQVYDKKCGAANDDAIVAVTESSAAPPPPRRSSSIQSASLAENNKTPHPPTPTSLQQTAQQNMNSQMAAMAAMSMGMGLQYPFMGVPFGPFGVPNPFLPMMMPPNGFDPLTFSIPSSSSAAPLPSKMNNSKPNFSMSAMNAAAVTTASAATPMLIQQQPKRARTRITDEQLKVLREYFDIYNSPSEEQIEQMSLKSGLPQKVIKHWFRNTLFKERQRSKDSPYNFNIPPSLGIDLEEYEKTGETKIIPYNNNAADSAEKASDTDAKSEKSTSTMENLEKSRVKEEIVEEPLEEKKLSIDETETNLESSVKREEAVNEFGDDEYDDYDDFDNVRDNACFSALNAHETLRQLAAVGLSNMQMQFRDAATVNNSEHMISPLSSLLNASMQNLQSASTTSTMNSSSDLSDMIANALTPNNPSMNAAGRRANRTRFTEWQVKTLQDFFEKNAYPKDDDLEVLSNKLNLSPRVIVVWFQNARQKARKIYENQPSSSDAVSAGGTIISGDDRFVRTPGLNYQCKKCKLVFQRYYELIKHQKSTCFKDETKFDNGDQSPPVPTNHSQNRSKSSSLNGRSQEKQHQKLSVGQQQKATVSVNNGTHESEQSKIHHSSNSAMFTQFPTNDSNKNLQISDVQSSFYAQLQSSLEGECIFFCSVSQSTTFVFTDWLVRLLLIDWVKVVLR